MSQKSFKESRKSNATFSLVEAREECSVYAEPCGRLKTVKREIYSLVQEGKTNGRTPQEDMRLRALRKEEDTLCNRVHRPIASPEAEAKRILNAERDEIHDLLKERDALGKFFPKWKQDRLEYLFNKVGAPSRGRTKNRAPTKMDREFNKVVNEYLGRSFLFGKEVNDFKARFASLKVEDGVYRCGATTVRFAKNRAPINTFCLMVVCE